MKKKRLPFLKEWRLNILLGLFFLIGCGLTLRFFELQVLHHDFYLQKAQAQYENKAEIQPIRGRIFLQDKEGENYLLATNRDYCSVYAIPSEIQRLENKEEKIEEIVQQLFELAALEKETIRQRLNKENDPYEPLIEKVSDDDCQELKALDLPGVHFKNESFRWYPQNSIAAHLLGFVGRTEQDQAIGQYGLEGYYDDILSGQAGVSVLEKDALGNWIGLAFDSLLPAVDGADLFLSVDQNIQFVIEKKLQEVVEKWQAQGGCALVMNPKNGEILGMAGYPTFDPNNYSEVENVDVFLNPCLQKVYEPGSIFKPITMSAGIDSGKVSPSTTFVDSGSVTVGGHVITNAANRTFGQSTMTQVLEKSINTGIVFVQQQLEKQELQNYIESFSFGRILGIDLIGELQGNISNLSHRRDIDYATIAFGQGVAVTPLQMISAISAIANGGQVVRPHLAKKIVESGGKEEVIESEVISQPISSQTALKLTNMLVSTVENGYDKINIDNYYIAGKTGTAQISDKETGGYSDQYIHSFIGFAPAYEPKFIVLLKLDEPQGIRFASSSLAPVFTDITRFLLNYFEISPDF